MKQFYQIHELAKLFDLCPDTLRYYEEKGLLHPVRGGAQHPDLSGVRRLSPGSSRIK